MTKPQCPHCEEASGQASLPLQGRGGGGGVFENLNKKLTLNLFDILLVFVLPRWRFLPSATILSGTDLHSSPLVIASNSVFSQANLLPFLVFIP